MYKRQGVFNALEISKGINTTDWNINDIWKRLYHCCLLYTSCFSNTGNRVVAVPWMSNWQYCNIVPTRQFRSANALPRELGLYTQDLSLIHI